MYSIIQKICEKNNKILEEGLKKVLSGDDVSSLTGAIKEFYKENCSNYNCSYCDFIYNIW